MNGETVTGVTTFFLDHDIDTGRIIMQRSFDIPDDADAEYVYDGLMHLGAQLCLETLEAVVAADGKPATMAQEVVENLKSAPKIFKETCEIDWTKSARKVYDFVRGLSPVPGAWTTFVAPDGKETVLKIYKTARTGEPGTGSGRIETKNKKLLIAAADELLEIVELQMAGKKRMTARDFMNGMKTLEMCRVK